jgi:TatD DNase family protein
MFTDSHCHLNFPELISQLPAIREAMVQAQVDRALCICTTMEEFEGVHALATAYDNFWSTVGVHPDNEGVIEPSVQDLLDRAALPRVVAIGETGLDYYGMEDRKGGRSIADLEWQRQRFRTHIRAARACGKPLVIHTRSALPRKNEQSLLCPPCGAAGGRDQVACAGGRGPRHQP